MIYKNYLKVTIFTALTSIALSTLGQVYSTLGKNICTVSIDFEVLFASVTVEELKPCCFSSEMAKGL